MSIRLTSRLEDPSRRVPVFPAGRPPRVLAGVVLAGAVGIAAIAVVDDRAGFRLVMASLAVVLLTVGVALLVMFAAIRPRLLTLDEDAPALRFVPPRRMTVPPIAIAASLLLPALAQAVVDAGGLPTLAGGRVLVVGPYLMAALGIVLLGVAGSRLRVPAGLTITPEGLRGLRGHGDFSWSWVDLADASVRAEPAAKLVLVPRTGARPVRAPALAIGSDPNDVAVLVRFYRDRPAERRVLAEGGPAAVAHAERQLARG